MSAPISEFIRIAEQGQEMAGQALRNWTETVQSYTEAITEARPAPKLAELSAAVDAYFDRAAEVLATQRDAAKTVVTAGTEAVEGAVERARTFAASLVPAATN
jgi:coenzyme F420-reducing hydrogenase gamma subunit